MVAAEPLEIAAPPAEQRMLFHNVSWNDYVALRDLLDSPGVRMTYSRGALEIMSPSIDHELWKKNTARFVELFAFVRGIDLRGYGSATFKKETALRGAEPDECYLIGKRISDYPEIVLEVIKTAPLLNKLDVYLAFGVREVWVFRDGRFTIHQLDASANRYVAGSSSAMLPELDFELLARFVPREDTLQALREFESLVRR